MAYTPTTWKDRVVENPRTYTIQDNGDGTITLIPAPGTVYEAGTPVNAPNLNKLENGLQAAAAIADAAIPKAPIDYLGDTADGTDVLTYNWQTGWYVVGWNTANMPIDNYWWRVQCFCENGNNLTLIAHGLSDPNLHYVRSKVSGAWSGWVQLITNAGGTFTGPINFGSSVGNKISLWGTDYGLAINSSELTLYTPSGAKLVHRDAPSGNILGDFWTTRQLRWNAASQALEYNDGGVWRAVGDIQVGRTRTASGNPSAAGVYTTILDVSGVSGKLYRAQARPSAATTINNARLRVTIDGVAEEVSVSNLTESNALAFISDITGGDLERTKPTLAPITFYNSLKVEVAASSNIGYFLGTVDYALKLGTP